MLQTLYRPILTIAIVATLAGAVAAQYLMAVAGLDPPTFTSPDTDPAGFNVAENTTAITTVVATGEGTITYSVSGTDSALVTIGESSGVLAFIDPPNYEGPLDVGGDNVYTFNVVASNGTPASFECNVTVTDESEGSPTPPTITNADPLNVSMGENSTSVADIDATGDAPITFSISGTDASLFTINSSTGVLSFTDAPDYETPGDNGGNNIYNLTVTATGVSPPDSIDVVVTVTDVDESEYTYYNTLVASADHLVSHAFRSQSAIDDAAGNMSVPCWPYLYTPGSNENFRYDATEDACLCWSGGSVFATSKVQLGFGGYITTGCLVAIRDLRFRSEYRAHAENIFNFKFHMLVGEGSNSGRKLESRIFFYDGSGMTGTSTSQYGMDTRPYDVGAAEATGDRIAPWTPVHAPTDEWVRWVEMVDFTTSPDPEYSFYCVESDDTITTVYEDIPLTTLVSFGGLNKFDPCWVNTSQTGENVSMTSSGTTVTVSFPGHELEVGDPIRLWTSAQATQTEYNGEWEVASVIDPDTFTYICDTTPSASSATPANGSYMRMITNRRVFHMRNVVVLHSSSTINLTPILVGDDL